MVRFVFGLVFGIALGVAAGVARVRREMPWARPAPLPVPEPAKRRAVTATDALYATGKLGASGQGEAAEVWTLR